MKLSEKRAAQIGLGAAAGVLLASIAILLPPTARPRIDVKSSTNQQPAQNASLTVVSDGSRASIPANASASFR